MDSESQIKGVERKKGWLEEHGIKRKIQLIFSLYGLVKLVISLIIQCVYLTLQESSKKKMNSVEEIRQIQENLNWIQNLKVSVGQIHRAHNYSGIF